MDTTRFGVAFWPLVSDALGEDGCDGRRRLDSLGAAAASSSTGAPVACRFSGTRVLDPSGSPIIRESRAATAERKLSGITLA